VKVINVIIALSFTNQNEPLKGRWVKTWCLSHVPWWVPWQSSRLPGGVSAYECSQRMHDWRFAQ